MAKVSEAARREIDSFPGLLVASGVEHYARQQGAEMKLARIAIALAEEVARLRGDEERLNWLEKNGDSLMYRASEGGWCIASSSFNTYSVKWQQSGFMPLREAIDAALQATREDT